MSFNTNGFLEKFGEQPDLVVRAPGRINFIGEHTDYNEGFVLPAAINKTVRIDVSKRKDNLIRLYSVQFNDFFEVRLEDIRPLAQHWANYILGVLDQLQKRGVALTGMNVLVDGNVPTGAGMSSSAALECAMAVAMNNLFSLRLNKYELVHIAQKAEHTYPGVHCGIMDQYASIFGRKDHAVKLDCRDISHEYVPLSLSGYSIVLFDTGVKHQLASSEYNRRRQECEAGVACIQKINPNIKSLRDATLLMIYRYIVDPVIRKRCEYVVKENTRLLSACEKLVAGDIISFGKKMYQTHKGLSGEYEVSCSELDLLVSLVIPHRAVIGARMMGGGFGGCTINLIKKGSVNEMIDRTGDAYYKATGKIMTNHIVTIEDGAEQISEVTEMGELKLKIVKR